MKKTAIILLALALAALMLAGCTGGGDDLSDAVEIPSMCPARALQALPRRR